MQVVAQLKATIDARLMSLSDDDEDDEDHLGDDGEDAHPQRFGATGGTAGTGGGGADDDMALLDATDDVDTTVSVCACTQRALAACACATCWPHRMPPPPSLPIHP